MQCPYDGRTFLLIVNEIEGLVVGLALVGWDGVDWAVDKSVSGTFSSGAGITFSMAEFAAMPGDVLELLAIASPTPAITEIGNENSANQCNPVTQLNIPSAIYNQTMLMAQTCIPLHQYYR